MRKIILFFIAVVTLNATIATYENSTTLYVATFDRTPDVGGLKYWVNDSKLNLEGIARSFMLQPESKAKYYPENTINVPDFVEEVYLNVFDHLPDSVGKKYWTNFIGKDFEKIAVFILAVINGAQGSDATILTNKTTYALDAIRNQLPDEPIKPTPDGMPSEIFWCHDYTLWMLTKGELVLHRTSSTLLRRYLDDMGLRQYSFPDGTDWKLLQEKLIKNDVIIIGDAHSGIVCDSKGTICHFLQDRTFHRDQLYQIMNFSRTWPNGSIQYPYKNKSVEVWRYHDVYER